MTVDGSSTMTSPATSRLGKPLVLDNSVAAPVVLDPTPLGVGVNARYFDQGGTVTVPIPAHNVGDTLVMVANVAYDSMVTGWTRAQPDVPLYTRTATDTATSETFNTNYGSEFLIWALKGQALLRDVIVGPTGASAAGSGGYGSLTGPSVTTTSAGQVLSFFSSGYSYGSGSMSTPTVGTYPAEIFALYGAVAGTWQAAAGPGVIPAVTVDLTAFVGYSAQSFAALFATTSQLEASAPSSSSQSDHYEGNYRMDTRVVGLGPEHAMVCMSAYPADNYDYDTIWCQLVKRVPDPDAPNGPGMLVQLPRPTGNVEFKDKGGTNPTYFVNDHAATEWTDEYALMWVALEPDNGDPGVEARTQPDSYTADNIRIDNYKVTVLSLVKRTGDAVQFVDQFDAAYGFAGNCDLVRISDTQMLCFLHEVNSPLDNSTFPSSGPNKWYRSKIVLVERSGDTISVVSQAPYWPQGAPCGAALIGPGLVLSLGNYYDDGVIPRVYRVTGSTVTLEHEAPMVTDFPGSLSYDMTGAGYTAPSGIRIRFPPFDTFGTGRAFDMIGTTDGKAVLVWGSDDRGVYGPQLNDALMGHTYSCEWSYDGTTVTHGPYTSLLPFPMTTGGSHRHPVRVAKAGDLLYVSSSIGKPAPGQTGPTPPAYKGIAQADFLDSATSIQAPAAANFSYGYDSVLLQIMHRSPLTDIPFGFTQIAQQVHYNGAQYQTWLLRNDGFTYQPTLTFETAGRLGVFTHTIEGKVTHSLPAYNADDSGNDSIAVTTPASTGPGLLLVGADHVGAGVGTSYDNPVPVIATRQGTDGSQPGQRLTMYSGGHTAAESPLTASIRLYFTIGIGTISMWFYKSMTTPFTDADYNYVDVKSLVCNLDGTLIDQETASNALGTYDVAGHSNYDDVSSDVLGTGLDAVAIISYTPHNDGRNGENGGTYSAAARRLHPDDYAQWYWTTPVLRLVRLNSLVIPSTPETPPTPITVVDGGELLRTRFVYGRT